MTDEFMIKFKPTFIKFYLNVNVGFAKVKIHKIVKLLCLKSWEKKDNNVS